MATSSLQELDKRVASSCGELCEKLVTIAESAKVPQTFVILPDSYQQFVESGGDRIPWELELEFASQYDKIGGCVWVFESLGRREFEKVPSTVCSKLELVRLVRQIWLKWREESVEPPCSLLVQKMLSVEASGTLCTYDPKSGKREIAVTALFGQPIETKGWDRFLLDYDGELLDRDHSVQTRMWVLEGEQLKRITLSKEEGEKEKLRKDDLAYLVELAESIDRLFDSPVMVHWLLQDGVFHVSRIYSLEVEKAPPEAPPEVQLFEVEPSPWEHVLERLEKAKAKDLKFGEGRILGSMCTEPLELSLKARSMFPEANLGNPGLCPGTKELEDEVIAMLAELLHGENVYGHMTSGGTEGNITSLWIARNLTNKREVLYPASAHFSILKACDLLRMKPVKIDLDEQYRMDLGDLEKKLSDDTAAVVAIAGTTELGMVDPIEKISLLCEGEVFLHVDAAFGGFVLPFMEDLGYEVPIFDFRLDGVTSIAIDGHKMGMAPIPSSALLLREAAYLRGISVESPYLTSLQQASLLGTRYSAAVAGTYTALKTLGRKGYADIVKRCLDVTSHIAKRVREMGLELAVEPQMNIIGILAENPKEMVKLLSKRGWVLSMSKRPRCVRLIIMPHINMEAAEAFLQDLESVSKEMKER